MTAAEPSALSYSASLPLSWKAASPLDAPVQARWHYANLTLLRALASIEAATPVESEHDHDSHLVKMLERLESKIDIALSLLSRLSNGQELPHQLPVTLSAQHVEWTDNTAPAPGQAITLTIYLSPKLPEPLMLSATVADVTTVGEGFHCVAELNEQDEEFLDWMTRTVFRYHRRALQARHQQ